MNVLDLFSGIGGFTLGLASAGPFRTVAFCECEPFPRDVLAARWPGVPVYPDVRTLTTAQLAADGVVRPDVVCGGFPCQDISSAGRGAGIDGARSGLWREMARIIGEVRPRWVVVENSPSLRGRGADRVLGDLEALGYAAWPSVVGAVHAGAWHRRQRVWIVAYADSVREHEPAAGGNHEQLWAADVGQPADFGSDRGEARAVPLRARRKAADGRGSRAPDAEGVRSQGSQLLQRIGAQEPNTVGSGSAQPGLVRVVYGLPARLDRSAGLEAAQGFPWFPLSQEPEIPRTARGVANRADRIAGLGNAVVPDVVAMIGRAILTVEAQL